MGAFILKNWIVVNEGKLDVFSKTTKITALWSVGLFVVVLYYTLIIEHENKEAEYHSCDRAPFGLYVIDKIYISTDIL